MVTGRHAQPVLAHSQGDDLDVTAGESPVAALKELARRRPRRENKSAQAIPVVEHNLEKHKARGRSKW
jgi:hypothetical protein